MKNSKLITLLKKFDRDELKQFEKFLASPFFSSGRKLQPYFGQLKKYYPGFDSVSFTEEKLFRNLYPGVKFSGSKSLHKIHVLSSDLFAMAEKFLVYSDIEKGRHKFFYNKFLAENYFKKELADHSLKVTLNNLKYINKSEDKTDYFWERLNNDMLLTAIFIVKNEPLNNFKYTSNSILYVYAFIFQVLAAYHNKHRANKRNYNLDFKGYDLVMHFVKSFDPELFMMECDEDEYETKNITLINYYILKSRIDESDEESFNHALKLYRQIYQKIEHYRRFELFLFLFNRCIGKMGSENKYRYAANDLIDMVWGSGIVSIQKGIPLNTMSYISGLFIKFAIKDTREIRSYIKKYSVLIQDSERVSLKSLSDAVVFFKDKQFDKCLKLLSLNDNGKIQFLKSPTYEMSLCCLYELNYADHFASTADNFDHFIRNNKNLSEMLKTGNQNFLKSIKKLQALKKNENGNRPILEKEIKELSKNSAYKWWFEEKIKEILKDK